MDNMYFNPFAQNVAIIKNYFKRKSVLVMAITFLLSVLLSLVTILLSINMLPDMLAQSNNLFRSAYSSSYSSSTSTLSVIYMIAIASIMPIIITGVLKFVSYILIYKKSNNPDPKSNPSAGFTILYVLSIISLVVACIASFLLVITMFVMFFASIYSATSTSYYSSQTSTVAALIVLMIFCAALIFFLLFAAINELKYFKSIRRSMSSIELNRRGAKPIGVLRIIYTVSLFSSLLLLILSIIILSAASHQIGTDFSNILTLAIIEIVLISVEIVYYICAAKVALGYANYIDNIKFGYNGSSSNAAPFEYTPAQPQAAQTATVNGDQPMPNIQQNDFVAQPGGKYLCPQCNNAVNTDDLFCNQCGYKLK